MLKSYYESAIAQGRILLSDQKVEPTHIIKGGDVLRYVALVRVLFDNSTII